MATRLRVVRALGLSFGGGFAGLGALCLVEATRGFEVWGRVGCADAGAYRIHCLRACQHGMARFRNNFQPSGERRVRFFQLIQTLSFSGLSCATQACAPKTASLTLNPNNAKTLNTLSLNVEAPNAEVFVDLLGWLHVFSNGDMVEHRTLNSRFMALTLIVNVLA